MSNSSNSGQVLSGLEGTQITMNSPPQPPINFVPETWEIVEKIGEDTVTQSEQNFIDGGGPAYVAGKFLCRPSGAQGPLAFLRIYQQIPWLGTELRKASARAAQATRPFEPPELQALKHFKQQGCNVVPELLGYQFEKQDKEDSIPGGFVTYVIWKKVPGEPLDFTRFWNCTFSERQNIRVKFRQIYEMLLPFDYQVWVPSSTKIIYEWSTGEMHISGFKDATNRFLDKVWSDAHYALHNLVLVDPSIKSYFPIESINLYRDDNGWEW
ncbi:hypothetical protein PEX1_049770 [Penicillium expansum]|uniref:Uncharacterized protein n=1 Tax=Penicillium expansum TaxID=27334 RepID=A0A0A2IEB0_PENEN|nr:hypothetical protein PEX2_096590 [Penicillium expansum]KGO40751.1 hypothetical protein PEXP_085630 [Penicillium expansum]KGO51119.1 hypothetical protein PEX2_096590 [Penicillium expansum]KGO66188.1 hypothetical protein PEX1_049770 [Penicillium expansum]